MNRDTRSLSNGSEPLQQIKFIESDEEIATSGFGDDSPKFLSSFGDGTATESFQYLRGSTPPLNELLCSANQTVKYSVVIRRDDVYIHTTIQTGKKGVGSDVYDHLPGCLFLIKDFSQKLNETSETTSRPNVMTTKSILESNVLVGSKTSLKSCYYLVWCPYSTLCTINDDLVLHSKSNGEIVTPDKYRHRLNKPETLSSSPSQGSIVDTSQMSQSIIQRNESAYAFVVRTVDISFIKKHDPTIGMPYLIVNMRDESSHLPLFFHDGGLMQFISEFNSYVTLQKSKKDNNVYYISADTSEPLKKSLNQFDFDVYFDDVYKEKEGYWQLLEWGSKITKGARDITNAIFATSETLPPPQPKGNDNLAMNLQAAKEKIEKEKKNVPTPIIITPLTQSVCDTYLDSDEIPQPLDDYFSDIIPSLPVTTNTQPKSNWKRKVEKPLDRETWLSFFDNEGRINDVEKLKTRIYFGGVDNSIRSEVWKFLLEYYPYNSTFSERGVLREQKAKEYEILKNQWKTISPKQESRFFQFRDRKSRIEKDVIRTDRLHPMFADDDSEWLVLLHDILLTYTFYNFDLSYVQGMGDFASPILEVMKDEVDSFWCFANLMELKQNNFELNSKGMDQQLISLANLINILDPEFYNHLQTVDALNLYYCFRWVLVELKREFNFDSCKRLWEKLWTNAFGSHFHLFVCYALLERIRDEIIQNGYKFDEILRLCIELSGSVALDDALFEAEKAYMEYKKKLEQMEDITAFNILL